MKRIIAISGNDGAGKSYLAGHLATLHGNAAVLSFAYRLRNLCVASGVLTAREAFAKPTKPYVRDRLNLYSMKIKRDYGRQFFAENLVQAIEEILPYMDTVIVHDMRYLDEMDRLIDLDGGDVKVFTVFIDSPPTGENYDYIEELYSLRRESDYILDTGFSQEDIIHLKEEFDDEVYED